MSTIKKKKKKIVKKKEEEAKQIKSFMKFIVFCLFIIC